MPKKRASAAIVPSVRPPPHDRRQNRLLAALPADDFARLLPHLERVPLQLREVLHQQGMPIRHVYFPNGGVVSITTTLISGMEVEAATIGVEGMLGVEAIFGDGAIAAGDTYLQVPTSRPEIDRNTPRRAAGADAEKMTVAAFRSELRTNGALQEVTGRYVQALIAQMMQSTACNAIHQTEQRCARWLLMTHDRLRTQEFRLSQEFLAMMLGVQRPTVTVVAGTLQQAGLIRYRHGVITIVDRRRLEAASCECYFIVRKRFDLLEQ